MRNARHLHVVQQSDIGLKRAKNEDHFGCSEPTEESLARRGWLYVVADGMGGHAAGEIASQIAVETILEEFYAFGDGADTAGALRASIVQANAGIFERGQEHRRLRGMGSTVVAAAVQGDLLTLANVGDSRAYWLREGRLTQLTRDHSWVAKSVEAGLLRPEQALGHPDRNVIYRCLGAAPTVEVDTFTYTLRPGDRVLLCSDGLTDMVSDEDIAVLAGLPDLAGAAKNLIDAANAGGGHDNITVTLIEVTPPDATSSSERPIPGRSQSLQPDARTPDASPPDSDHSRGERAADDDGEAGDATERPAPKRKGNWLGRLLRNV